MKKNLLFILLSVITGMASAVAENVTARIMVDKAANVIVTNGMYGQVVDLIDGMNYPVTLDDSMNPLVIKAADGAEIVEVTKNNESVNPGYNGYTIGIEPGMFINITTTGGAVVAKTYKVWFQVTPLGSISVSDGNNKVVIDQMQYFDMPANTDLTIAPEEGFNILNVEYNNHTATDNGNGTWTINVTEDYGFVTVNVEEKGIHFNVETSLASNLNVNAILDNDATEQKTLTPSGTGPYAYVAPEGTKALQFAAAEGAEIKSIVRIDADGNRSDVNFSGYVGWRAMIAEGDTYIVDAVGPEIDVNFLMQRTAVTLDQMVITANGERLAVTEANTSAKVHAGDVIEIAGGKGATLTSIYTAIGQMLVANGATQSFKVTGAGDVYIYAEVFAGKTITVDNADAVIVKDMNGYGEAIALVNGANNIEATLNNPLSVAPVAGYAIVSVELNGEAVAAKADGAYTVVLEDGSKINIVTKELPKAVPVTFAVSGDYNKLSVALEGEPVNLSGESSLISVMPGSQLTVSPMQGYVVESLIAGNGNVVALNEETGEYTVTINNAGTVSVVVKERVAAEGYALVTFNADSYKVAALVFDEEGTQTGSLKLNDITEVKIGSRIRIYSYSDPYFKSVTVNGVEIAEAKDAKEVYVTVEDAMVIDVTTYLLCTVTGYSTNSPVIHTAIGYIYINEVGQSSAALPTGSTVTLLPTAMPGYKFTGFSFIYPDDIKLPAEAPYTFVIPEGATEIIFQGSFEEDEEEPSYLVRGNNTYGYNDDVMEIIGFTRINDEANPQSPLPEKLCKAGETVQLLCCVVSEDYYCKNFTLFNDNTKVLDQMYVVNPEDVTYDNVIEVSAIIEKKSAGINGVAVGGALAYDRATSTVYAPSTLRVYGASGNLVIEAEAGATSIESLPAGIYVIVSGGKTMKVVK